MFLSCGDSLFDMFIDAKSDSGSVDGASAKADNTRVSIEGVVGGSPMNVALGVSRLGHSSRYLTKLSHDVFGQRIARFLDNNNINHQLSPRTDLNTTLAMVETMADGSAKYAFYIKQSADVGIEFHDIPKELPNDIRVLHFGSYSTVVEPTASSLVRFATEQSANKVVSYDPNLRLSIEPDIERWHAAFASFAAQADLIKASDEDIEALFGSGSAGEEKFVAACMDHGASVAYITRGANGGSAFDKDGRSSHKNGASIQVVDTVGAGDTFQAALLHWMAAHKHVGGTASLEGSIDLGASLEFAIRAAAITCTRRGADLPYLSDLS